tara:strand:- start:20667 stop:22550 length:1884 start_codon:yes stop_codon:yes gene_type:complete
MIEKKICFISELSDLSSIQDSNAEVFTFDYKSHKNLKNSKIEHMIADKFLDYNERSWIFEQAKKFERWYNNESLEKFELENFNIFSLLDGIEFHTLLMEKLIIFWTIKKILEKKTPTKIICPYEMKEIIQLLDIKNNIKLEFNSKRKNKKLIWDSINIKHNIVGKPISINISRNKFNKLKNILDKTVGLTFGLWFDFKNKNKKTILLLEMYPPIYKDLIQNLKNEKYNIIIINRRRPVTLEKKSINILKNSNCKIISENDLFEKEDMKKILEANHKCSQKIESIWENDTCFKKIFKINDIIFWPIIKNELKEVFQKRIEEYVKLIFFTKKVFEKINVTYILSLYESGETEKAFLINKNKKIESFLLEHGFSIMFENTKKYGMLASYDDFTDKIVVWSDFQKEFLISNYNIDAKRILAVGSPRHDILTQKINLKKQNEKTTILIAPTPITQLRGYDVTQIHERFEEVIKNLAKQLQNVDVDVIFKIHPSQSEHNNEIIQMIKKYVKQPVIFLFNPVVNLIESSDLIITITPEGWAPSTIMLEGMILGKPVLNIILDEKIYDFEYIKMNAAIASSFDSFTNILSKLINDIEYRNVISTNGKVFSKKFLCNYGNSSEKLAKILTDERKIS